MNYDLPIKQLTDSPIYQTMRRILTRIIIWTAIVLVVLVGAVVGGTILLKDRLINYSIQAINNELNAPVNVDGIHFLSSTLFRTHQ